MYEKELMMAIVTASPALVGLTGVIIGQIAQSERLGISRRSWLIKVPLLLSFVFGLAAVGFAIDWLVSPEYVDRVVAVLLFSARLFLVAVATVAFWLPQ